MSKISKHIFFLFFGILNIGITLGQNIPNIDSPDFLQGRNHFFDITEGLEEDLKVTLNVEDREYCCNNMFTDKPMENFSLQIYFTNTTNNKVFFIKLPKHSSTIVRRNHKTNACSEQANLIIYNSTPNKTFQIDPGKTISFHAKTDMYQNDFYPISVEEHEEILAMQGDYFIPDCIYLFFYKAFVKISTTTNPTNPVNNNNNTGNNTNDVDDLISELELDLESQIEIENNQILENNIQSYNLDEIVIQETDDKEITTHNYDPNVCNNLKQEIRSMLNQTANISQSNYTNIMISIQSFTERMDSYVNNDNLDPKCFDEIEIELQNFSQRIMSQFNTNLNGLNQPQIETKKSNGPVFAKPTMTTSFPSKGTPSLKSDSFGSGKVSPIKKKVNN
ncbi:hypothetical protein [uncultured Flavobacterium sp.]|uniref:hypothetical protein n=1 Tax=uncultured Flavobacterium sp. TaxID=165435 RepID=UPI0030C81AA9